MIMTNILLLLILIALVFGGATVIKIIYAVGSVAGILMLYVAALVATCLTLLAYGRITNDARFLLTFSMKRWLRRHIRRNFPKGSKMWRVSLAKLYGALPEPWKDRIAGWPVKYEFTDEIKMTMKEADFSGLELSLEGDTEGPNRNRLEDIFLIVKRV